MGFANNPSLLSKQATMQLMRLIKHILFLLFSILSLAKPDPDLLVDYCVADTAGMQSLFFNGAPCIDPALTLSSHFTTSVLSKPGDTSRNLFGFNVTITTNTNLPGANAQGLTMARIDIGPNGLVPLHSHPRASEAALLLRGVLLVGFVDTSNRLFTQQLRPGDAFMFPRGMLHFLYNLDAKLPAFVISGLSSQSPGVQLMAIAPFRSEPQIPDFVLQKSLKVSEQDIKRIQRNLGG